jgi:hypothetical protein
MGEPCSAFCGQYFNQLLQSYGGFMASKVAEANAGIHSLAMAVAVCVCLTDEVIALTSNSSL